MAPQKKQDDFQLDGVTPNTFREVDQKYSGAQKSDLDGAALESVLRFVENTEVLSPLGLQLVTAFEPRIEKHFSYERKSIFPGLDDVFPNTSLKAIKKLGKLQDEYDELKREERGFRKDKNSANAIIRHRKKSIKKYEAALKGAGENKVLIQEMTSLTAEAQEEIDEAEKDAVKAQLGIDKIRPKLKKKDKEIDQAYWFAKSRAYDKISFEGLMANNKEGKEKRDQLKADWKFLKNWLKTEIKKHREDSQPQFIKNLNMLCEGISISDEDKRFFLNEYMIENVESLKKFYSILRGEFYIFSIMIRAKLAGIDPDKIEKMEREDTDLTRKGLLKRSNFTNMEINQRVIHLLSVPAQSKEYFLKKIAGLPAHEKEHKGFTWEDTAEIQGAGARKAFQILKNGQEKGKTVRLFFFGEKGASKTQGGIKAALAAGYKNAVFAPEFDDDGKPLSYSERLAAIRLSEAVGKNIPGFLLIIDEIDKMGGDKGTKNSPELLRLCENISVPTIYTANDMAFSEAIKDRFGFPVRFHVPLSDRRISTFFNLAQGKLSDLDEKQQEYEDLLRKTDINPRGMEQAVEWAQITGDGIDTIRQAFRAKAELMTGSRTGFVNDEPIIEPWRFEYFNGVLRDYKKTPIPSLIKHMASLPKDEQNLKLLLAAHQEGAEMQAFANQLAERMGLSILWMEGDEDFSDTRALEALLNRSEDMGLMLAINKADGLLQSSDEQIKIMMDRHPAPIVFLASNADFLNRDTQQYEQMTFVIDCYSPTEKQCADISKRVLNLDVDEKFFKQFPNISLDVFETVAKKRRKVLADPENKEQVLELLKMEYSRRYEGKDQRPVPIQIVNDNKSTKSNLDLFLGGKKEAPKSNLDFFK